MPYSTPASQGRQGGPKPEKGDDDGDDDNKKESLLQPFLNEIENVPGKLKSSTGIEQTHHAISRTWIAREKKIQERRRRSMK